MKRIVFYSWQSDLPNPTNRGFIQSALEDAAKAIAVDDSVAVEPVVDRDTSGVPGSPDIASTIFSKISIANVVVADISIINTGQGGRPMPNPNVLIELGYALKSLGHERVILVFNEAYGKIMDLPFDLRMRRLVIYSMSEIAKDRTIERKELKNTLESAIRSALTSAPNTDEVSLIPAVDVIENSRPNKIIVLRRNLDSLLKKIVVLEPKKHRDGGTVDELLAAIDSTQEAVAEFSKIAETISVMNDRECAFEIFHWFGNIFERYNLPYGFSGKFSDADFDYFKFIGHELFVTLVAFMIREQGWKLLGAVLDEPIPVHSLPGPGRTGPGNVEWESLSSFLHLLNDENHKKKRISIHADKLFHRHTEGGLSITLPFEDFVGADFFLYLVSFSSKNEQMWRRWYPRSIVYMKHMPLFIRRAEMIRVAEQLMKIFKVSDSAKLKKKIREALVEFFERNPTISRGLLRNPMDEADIEKIGSR